MTTHLGGSVSWLLRDTSEKVFVTDPATPSCVYLRDEDTGKYWNVAYAPTCGEVEDYTCEHGLTFSRFSSRRGGIYASQCVTVLPQDTAEVWKVTAKNESDRARHVSVFSFSQLNLNGFTLKDTETLFCQLISPFMPDDTAESVFMAMLICYSFGQLIELSRHVGGVARADELAAFREKLADHTNRVAWNGDYYVRAFSKFGVVGDKTSHNGGNIYVNPQAWAILSGIVPQDRLPAVLAAIDGMETECGVPICAPPYRRYDPAVGRMSAMPPGVYENGGIYNHASAFKVMADCQIGRGDNAVETLLKMIPGGKANPSEITTTEPYVFTNCYLKHENEDMVVGFSWQTGSSAWGLRDYYEGILGLTRTFDGLAISPNIPASWDVVEAQRPYRGSMLHIRIENAGGDTVALTVDGTPIAGDIIPAFEDNAPHEIVVKMV